MIRVYTSPRSWYWATFIDVLDSETILVRCVSKEHLHAVRRRDVH